MPWDGMRKRSDDRGQDSPDVILARVDENIKFLKSGAETVRLQLFEHEKKDEKKFDDIATKLTGINKSIWFVSGGGAVIVFIINLFKH